MSQHATRPYVPQRQLEAAAADWAPAAVDRAAPAAVDWAVAAVDWAPAAADCCRDD